MFEFCEYNPYTLTGRPSNHFNGINYAALNKADGSRKRFVSRHRKGFLVEVDLSGFHLYLLYTILGLKFPESIYDDLKKYYPKDEDPKTYTFKQIYGGITKELQDIEPFKSISNLSRNVYLQYKTGNLKTFLYEKPVRNDIIEGDNQTKIFNYMLQNLETEFNNELLTKIHLYLEGKSTKLILYTYDSFLFDYDMGDGTNTLKEIIGLFENIPKHIKAGLNYHEMRNFNCE